MATLPFGIGLGGATDVQLRPRRSMGPFTAYVVLEEQHHDVIEITQHPVDVGASVADHSYKRPAELTLKGGYGDSPEEAYHRMLVLQDQRIPFDVYTGKRKYTNMMIRALTVSTDQRTESVLMFTAELQEVLIATPRVIQLNSAAAADQANAKDTQPIIGQGLKGLSPAENFNSSASPPIKSIMFTKG